MSQETPSKSQDASSGRGFSMTLQKSKTKKVERRNLDVFPSETYKKRRITEDPDQPAIELITCIEDNQLQSLNPKKDDKDLVIPTLKNDWMERNRTLASARYLPQNENEEVKTTTELLTNTGSSYGLTINKKTANDASNEATDEIRGEITVTHSIEASIIMSSDSLDDEQSLRQQALTALMRGSDEGDSSEQQESNLVLQVGENRNIEAKRDKLSETEAFQRDIANLPDEADIDYDSVPIDEFGLAMLRGMGWKPGMAIGKNQNIKPKELYEPKARPTHLGLGASPFPNTSNDKKSIRSFKRDNTSTNGQKSRYRSVSPPPSERIKGKSQGSSSKRNKDRSRNRSRSTERSHRKSRDRSRRDRSKDRSSYNESSSKRHGTTS
ncbi:5329_t:CDS:2 [Acaulospora morrowiae]|uniref:5329_t:CDS:1 n=1 Tax=Acaulospora morrowiae TaxID=94023 RepID=A0A9N9E2F7_9GLOM|nr:5329_t:CDS:2 [Acaulospora morrowiae]